jgi:hypothetical protein
MLRRVALVRTYVSEELSASFIRVTIIGEIGATPAALVTAGVNPSTLIIDILITEVISTSETSDVTRTTRHNIAEDTILLCASL